MTTVLTQATITKYHRLGGLTNKNLFSHSSGGWASKCQCVGFWWGVSSWLVLLPSCCLFTWQGGVGGETDRQTHNTRTYFSVSSYKGTNPIMRAPPSWPPNPNYLPKALSPNTIILGLGLQHMNFGWTQVNLYQQLLSQSYFICVKVIKYIFRINEYDIKYPRYILILR